MLSEVCLLANVHAITYICIQHCWINLYPLNRGYNDLSGGSLMVCLIQFQISYPAILKKKPNASTILNSTMSRGFVACPTSENK